QGESAQWNTDNNAWFGSLSDINIASGYWLGVVEPDTVQVCGYSFNPDRIYNFQSPGSNLISFPVPWCVPVEDAIPDEIQLYLQNQSNDSFASNFFIGEGQASVLMDYEWIGSLENLCGAKGYWASVSSEVSFIFVTGDQSERDVGQLTRELADSPIEKYPEGFVYPQSSQQSFFIIDEIDRNEDVSLDDSWILSYCNYNLAGARKWSDEMLDIPIMGYNGTPETKGLCEPGDIPQLKLLTANGDLMI
ncbi:uncharacterized protein METZ01_LOCUS468331, partial [marine metagenome]